MYARKWHRTYHALAARYTLNLIINSLITRTCFGSGCLNRRDPCSGPIQGLEDAACFFPSLFDGSFVGTYIDLLCNEQSVGPGFAIVSCRFSYSANQLLCLYWDRYLPL
ncbi:hypothetical protein LB506_000148 [Fusarium annulatum]|nr:hypothetical protein LB506_000148 [Fusarium annulatum]